MHTLSPWCISVCKFNVSEFGEGLNNAQRDNKIEWMSVYLLLANFRSDLLHSTVPVTACDTFTHTSLLRIQNTMVASIQVLNHRQIFCVLILCIEFFILIFPINIRIITYKNVVTSKGKATKTFTSRLKTTPMSFRVLVKATLINTSILKMCQMTMCNVQGAVGEKPTENCCPTVQL